jgi:hypothetical protein
MPLDFILSQLNLTDIFATSDFQDLFQYYVPKFPQAFCSQMFTNKM